MRADSMGHDLLVYDSDEQYAQEVVPYFEAGLEEGAALVAVPGHATEPLLRDALGTVSERVTFHIGDEWYTRPEAALAGYDAAVRGFQRDGAPGVCVVGELPYCSTQQEWDAWVRYEAIINRAFADRPVAILCTCDSRQMPEQVVHGMRHTHSHVVSGGRKEENPDYRDPAEVLWSCEPQPEPLPELRVVPVGGDARTLRVALSRELADAGVGPDQADAMVLAASEVVVNARRHGDGVRTLRVGGGDGTFVCEVSDAGPGLEDPLAGYLPPGAPAGGGGLWVARQLTRRLDLLPTPEGGLTVRLWA